MKLVTKREARELYRRGHRIVAVPQGRDVHSEYVRTLKMEENPHPCEFDLMVNNMEAFHQVPVNLYWEEGPSPGEEDLLQASRHVLNYLDAVRDCGFPQVLRHPVVLSDGVGYYTLDALLRAAIRRATKE